MPVVVTWHEIAIRLLLASLASFLIGLNRGERGKTAGVRTIMLVCLAATLAMIQANALMPLAGRAPNSFVMLDLMRFPLGILSGIGFIGAGAILRKDSMVIGLTTAATLWYVTVLGLLFGGGQLGIAVTGSVLGLVILWLLKMVERRLPIQHHVFLTLGFEDQPMSEPELRDLLKSHGYHVSTWNVHYKGTSVTEIECELRKMMSSHGTPATPAFITTLAATPGIARLHWRS